MTMFEIAALGLLTYIVVRLEILLGDVTRRLAAIESASEKTFGRVFNVQERLKWQFPIGAKEFNHRQTSERAGWDPSQSADS